MWETKVFKTNAAKDAWVSKNERRFQIEEIFVNNGFGVMYKRLLVINIR